MHLDGQPVIRRSGSSPAPGPRPQAREGQRRVGGDRRRAALRRRDRSGVAGLRPVVGGRQGADHDAAGRRRRREGRRHRARHQREGPDRQRGGQGVAVDRQGHAREPRPAAQRRDDHPRRSDASDQPADAGLRQPRRRDGEAHGLRRQGSVAQRPLRQLRAESGTTDGHPARVDEGRQRPRDDPRLLRPRPAGRGRAEGDGRRARRRSGAPQTARHREGRHASARTPGSDAIPVAQRARARVRRGRRQGREHRPRPGRRRTRPAHDDRIRTRSTSGR